MGRRSFYVCGDATMAYRPTVDNQFLDMLAKSRIAPTPENGFGDARLKLFDAPPDSRFRPDTLVVYDVLESEVASEWMLLLHTMKPPTLGSVRATEPGHEQERGSRVGDRFRVPNLRRLCRINSIGNRKTPSRNTAPRPISTTSIINPWKSPKRCGS